MMQLHYNRPNDLARLFGELLAAGLLPATINECWPMSGLGDDIWINAPDDADEAAIAAVVAAHDPTPRPQTDPPTIEDQIAAMQAAILDLALGGV